MSIDQIGQKWAERFDEQESKWQSRFSELDSKWQERYDDLGRKWRERYAEQNRRWQEHCDSTNLFHRCLLFVVCFVAPAIGVLIGRLGR